MIRAQHGHTGMRPFEKARCADLGDVAPNPADLHDSLERFETFYANDKAKRLVGFAPSHAWRDDVG